jgi:hypothetical protein
MTSVTPKAERRELWLNRGQRRQDQTDAAKKLTDPDEDEEVLRHGGQPWHLLKRLAPQGRLVTQDLAETIEAEEHAPQGLRGPQRDIQGRGFVVGD